MNPHDSIFFAPPITEVPDYVWSRQYDKPCFVPGRPIKNPQRHQPKDFTSRCRIGPACRKESLPPVPGSMVWPLFLQSRCCRIPGLRGHHGRGAPCRRTIEPKEGFGSIVPSTGGSAAQADIESGHPHPAVQQSWPAQCGQDGTYKGKKVWETVAGQVVHRLPSGLSPSPQGR